MSIFDNILAGIDENDRQTISKYPQLRSTLDSLEEINARNQDWLEKYYNQAAGKTYREIQLEASLDQAQERLSAVAGGGENVNFDEVLSKLKETKAVVTPDDLAAARQEFGQFVNQRDLGAMTFSGHIANLARRHYDEFGADLDVDGFAKHFATSGSSSPVDSYNQFVATARAEKAQKQVEEREAAHKAELERVRQESEEAGRRRGMMEVAQQTGGGMPVDQGRGPSHMGWLQKRAIERSRSVDESGNQMVPGGKLGDGTTTSAILAQLDKDRAEGKVPSAVQ